MSLLAEIAKIKEIYDQFDWFESVNIKDNKVFIYVNKMSGDIFEKIPDKFNGKPVKIHYQQSKDCNSGNYLKHYTFESLDHDFKLIEFVQKNTEIYGRRVMANMFYEIHDGENCLTNLKIKYPHLHTEMLIFYENYGYLSLVRELRPYGIVT